MDAYAKFIWATWAPCRGCHPRVPGGTDSLLLFVQLHVFFVLLRH